MSNHKSNEFKFREEGENLADPIQSQALVTTSIYQHNVLKEPLMLMYPQMPKQCLTRAQIQMKGYSFRNRETVIEECLLVLRTM
jgi:hypothetical protein